PLAAQEPGAQADRDRSRSDHEGCDGAPNADWRQGDERREDADDDPGPGHRPRTLRKPVHAVDLRSRVRRKRARTTSTSTSAPTKSTTSPWMMTARLPPTPGAKMVGSRLRDAVPVCKAAKRSAARPTPTALLRPSRATAIPMKPMFAPWMV